MYGSFPSSHAVSATHLGSKGISMRHTRSWKMHRDPQLLKTAKRTCLRSPSRRRFHSQDRQDISAGTVREAYQYLESNQQVGKVVITVRDE